MSGGKLPGDLPDVAHRIRIFVAPPPFALNPPELPPHLQIHALAGGRVDQMSGDRIKSSYKSLHGGDVTI